MQARLWRFVKSWLLVVAFAALSILHGKWQPMVFFTLVRRDVISLVSVGLQDEQISIVQCHAPEMVPRYLFVLLRIMTSRNSQSRPSSLADDPPTSGHPSRSR